MGRLERLESDLAFIRGFGLAWVVAWITLAGWTMGAALDGKNLAYIIVGIIGLVIIGLILWYTWKTYKPKADELERIKSDE